MPCFLSCFDWMAHLCSISLYCYYGIDESWFILIATYLSLHVYMHNYFYVEHVIQDFMVNLSYKLSESDGVDVLHREPQMGRWWDPTHASVFLSYFAEGLT